MPLLLPLLVLVALVVGLVWFYRRDELFVVSVRQGRSLLVRGRIPAGLFGEFREVFRQERVGSATVRAYLTEGGARLQVRGPDEGVAQQLRNVFNLHHASKLRAAPRPDARNLGQILGVAWLAWLLLDRG